MATATRCVVKSMQSPDEIRQFPDNAGAMHVVEIGDEVVGRATFEPGWQWTRTMRPRIGGDLCQVNHSLYVVSGRMGIRMEDGTEVEIGPGDAASIPPGHDAWTIGDEACVCIDWTGARTYAR